MLLKQWQTLTREKKALLLLLTVFLLKGLLYAFIFPLWQAPDEPSHYQTIINKAAFISSAFQRSPTFYDSKPPLSYWLSAFIVLPFAGSSVITRAYVLRFFHLLLNLGVVYLAYKTANKVLPNQPLIALATAFLIAMLPMYNHTGSAINSDNLANLIFTAFIYLSVFNLLEGFTFSRSLLTVSLVALGLLTKRTTFPAVLLLFALPFLTLLKHAHQGWLKQNALRLAGFFLISLLALPFINLLALNFGQVNLFTLAQENFNLATFSSLRDKLNQPWTVFTMTFWGDFGWANVPLDFYWYSRLNKVFWLPVFGLFVVLRQLSSKKVSFSPAQTAALLFLLLTLVLVLFVTLFFQPLWVKTYTWMPQARYAWVTLLPLAFFFAFGVLFPFKNKVVPFLILTLAATIYEVAVLFTVVIPHYYSALLSFSRVQLADLYSASGQAGTQQAVSLRPAFLNSSFFYLTLFMLVYLTLISFFYQAVKVAQERQ